MNQNNARARIAPEPPRDFYPAGSRTRSGSSAWNVRTTRVAKDGAPIVGFRRRDCESTALRSRTLRIPRDLRKFEGRLARSSCTFAITKHRAIAKMNKKARVITVTLIRAPRAIMINQDCRRDRVEENTRSLRVQYLFSRRVLLHACHTENDPQYHRTSPFSKPLVAPRR